MQTRQCNASTYHNRKIKSNTLKKGDLVFIWLPQNVKQKLSYKREGPHKIRQVSHTAYRIGVKTVSVTCYK